MTKRSHHRPSPQGGEFFDALIGAQDPALVAEAADRAATLLVRGASSSDDARVAERLLTLADDEGLETLAELWSGASPDSLAGCLWRLYVLRSWVYADPELAARQFEAGRGNAEVARVVAGVADPPGPDQVRAMIDAVLRGVADGDFADVVLRAAAFSRVVAVGRAHLGATDAKAMLVLSEQFEVAAHLELDHALA
ncbi:hypothetical protein BJ980_001455 [Nocardioides daedukensis]|uniref:DNA-directed RNA polymerase subunit beta n=1 Tax=Nocardioides daedukensis TaxID=634462 RepID=A0A7Y9S116_9ACTN|nr:hypothetical protein [Nocardioides daedukensis]NYG58532.1 hypothetical protein [Nocardioides daedukensis]